jgi:nucleoside-diphosphate-sugar epimerase
MTTIDQDLRRVVVTGSHGRLGRAVVAHLRSIGLEVLAVDGVAGRDPRDTGWPWLGL